RIPAEVRRAKAEARECLNGLATARAAAAHPGDRGVAGLSIVGPTVTYEVESRVRRGRIAEIDVDDAVVAVRVLGQLAAVVEEAVLAEETGSRRARVHLLAGCLVFGRHLGVDVEVGGVADLVLAVRRDVPGRCMELHPFARWRHRRRGDLDRT